MSPFAVDKRDILFCIYEFLGLEKLFSLPRYSEFNRELCDMVIDEAIKFATDILAPLNPILDRQGVSFQAGRVSVPNECHQVYRKFYEAGWGATTGSKEYGGQDLPFVLHTAVVEIMSQASLSFLLTPGLTLAAAHVIESCGTEQMKAMYVEKMYQGLWSGTMCLTEAGAGSAVGDLKTKAVPEKDHYLIEGEKIFISSGEHDLTDNIIHLVLARIEGAPEGMKGVSLFLVPKIRVNQAGSLEESNNVICGGIEHKMGIHGSPTCTMVFGSQGPCHGYLIGEENRGIQYMFLMMNEARIGVGLQGLSSAGASYQEALQYAKERIQGVDLMDMRDVNAPRVPIIRHPDVRRNLITMKAFTEGFRAMLLFAAKCQDLSVAAQDEETRSTNKYLLELLTPICKAYCSDWGFLMTSIGIQVFGGYGYTQEYPQEQYCRDCRIAAIYEGTNGIQALDLLGRKVSGKGALVFMTFLNLINEFIDSKRNDDFAAPYINQLEKTRDDISEVVIHFQHMGATGDMYYPVLCASPFLNLMGHFIMSYLLLDMAILAHGKLEEMYRRHNAATTEQRSTLIIENVQADFYFGKIKSMQFFLANYLPQAQAIAKTILSSDRSALEIYF